MKRILLVFSTFFIYTGMALSQVGTLTATQVVTDPTIDGVVDQVWDNATAINIPLGETYDVHDPASIMDCNGCHAFDSYVSVDLKAVYSTTTDRIYFLASWPDSTASFTRGGSWSFSGGTWEKLTPEQSEDRLAFFFPIGTIVGDPYNTGGCMAKCHTYWPTDTDPHVSTHGIVDDAWLENGRGDMWHSKGARGAAYLSASGSNLVIDPVTHQVVDGTFSMTGYADDKYVDIWLPDSLNGEDGGRYGDDGTSGYKHNRIGDKSRPQFMESNPTDYADAMFLTQEEIDGGEVIGNATNGVSDADAATYWPNYAGFNAVVPERILRMPQGSRGNLSFGAVWNNNMWTAEFGRDLITSNDDDIQFDLANIYSFEVAGFDNSRHGYEHRTSQIYDLAFGPTVGIDDEINEVPSAYSLDQCYPNPFNPSTIISYQLPHNGFVSLKVYDAIGNEVATLVNGMKEAGIYKIQFNSSGIPSGVYFYSINANGFHQTRKMIVLR